MNVQLLPAALKDIGVLRATGFRGAGFLLGSAIGHFVLVERLLPMDFDRQGGDAAYAAAGETYGEQLLGVFFCRKPPIALPGAIGGLVLDVRRNDMRVFTCEFDAAGSKARLAPLLEETEVKWQN
ncbi:MAG: hypothetical protein PHX05_04305 [Acidobacteriota bacterium]|jgi:hypothetical protein|nr:hypothetical protein [Acidobacteriota bacterium]